MPRLIKLSLWCILGVLALTGACNWWLIAVSKKRIHSHPVFVPETEIAIVLGTAPRLSSGPNRFFEGRMNTAAQLWRDRKVQRFLVSGDHGQKNYDEVTAMRDALVSRGVPSKLITLDHAGFRTLDSMERARQVFGVKRAVVVTDDWHLPRALFLARSAGLDAEGACFESVPWDVSIKTRAREWFSRVMAVADVYVLGTKPKYLGERVALSESGA